MNTQFLCTYSHFEDRILQRALNFVQFFSRFVDMDMSYTRVLHPKVLHQRTASQGRALCKSQMTSRVLRHTAAAMREHTVLQETVEQLR
jgi:hypothetical protein